MKSTIEELRTALEESEKAVKKAVELAAALRLPEASEPFDYSGHAISSYNVCGNPVLPIALPPGTEPGTFFDFKVRKSTDQDAPASKPLKSIDWGAIDISDQPRFGERVGYMLNDPGVACAVKPQPQPRDESRDVWVTADYSVDGSRLAFGVPKCSGYERYVPYAQLEEALGKCSGCGGDNCSRMWSEQKKCCPDCKCKVTDSVLLDAILEEFENPRSEALYDALKIAIAERAKR